LQPLKKPDFVPDAPDPLVTRGFGRIDTGSIPGQSLCRGSLNVHPLDTDRIQPGEDWVRGQRRRYGNRSTGAPRLVAGPAVRARAGRYLARGVDAGRSQISPPLREAKRCPNLVVVENRRAAGAHLRHAATADHEGTAIVVLVWPPPMPSGAVVAGANLITPAPQRRAVGSRLEQLLMAPRAPGLHPGARRAGPTRSRTTPRIPGDVPGHLQGAAHRGGTVLLREQLDVTPPARPGGTVHVSRWFERSG
jgi:hypothetical protein